MLKTNLFLFTLGALCTAVCASVLANEMTGVELIQKWVTAIGGPERVSSVETIVSRIRVSTAGMEGSVLEWSTMRGQIRQDLDLAGVYSTHTVFDGQTGWVKDHNGKVRELQGVEREDQFTSAYFSSLSHLVPGRRPGKIESLGTVDSGKYYRLEFRPEGGKQVVMYLDGQTYLPSRQERTADDRTEITYFEDWRPVAGLLLPHAIRVTTGDPQYDTRLVVEEVQLNATPPADAFEPPQEGPKDYRFAAGTSALSIPFELNSNHIYVRAQVNGGEWLSFIFDTGAGVTVLDRKRAESLGLPLQGQMEGRGAGEGSVPVSMIPGASIALPGVELIDQTIMAISLDMVAPYEGRPVDGILGYDLISRFVVKLDYAGRRLDLHEPGSYTYSGPGERIALLLEDNHPHIMAEVSVGDRLPVKANFLIDTGARSALSLSRPFCEEQGFVGAVPTISGGFGAGVGGETREQIGRVARLRLGNIQLSDVVTGFSEDQKGAGASRETEGNIGGDVMRRFTAIFDYSRQEMILEPNADFAQPFEYDMCGAFLRTTAADFSGIEIHRIIAGSPAEAAGLVEGDVITAIDGRAAGEFTLESVRTLFRVSDREYRLEIRRGDEVRQAVVKTKRLI